MRDQPVALHIEVTIVQSQQTIDQNNKLLVTHQFGVTAPGPVPTPPHTLRAVGEGFGEPQDPAPPPIVVHGTLYINDPMFADNFRVGDKLIVTLAPAG